MTPKIRHPKVQTTKFELIEPKEEFRCSFCYEQEHVSCLHASYISGSGTSFFICQKCAKELGSLLICKAGEKK